MFFKSMMSKMQKTWLWVFAGMFLIPEVLWSPVSNLCYELLNNNGHPYRATFLTNPDNMAWLACVLFLQFLGSLCFSLLMWKNIKKSHYYWAGAIFSTLLALISFFLFYLSMTLGMHGIG